MVLINVHWFLLTCTKTKKRRYGSMQQLNLIVSFKRFRGFVLDHPVVSFRPHPGFSTCWISHDLNDLYICYFHSYFQVRSCWIVIWAVHVNNVFEYNWPIFTQYRMSENTDICRNANKPRSSWRKFKYCCGYTENVMWTVI